MLVASAVNVTLSPTILVTCDGLTVTLGAGTVDVAGYVTVKVRVLPSTSALITPLDAIPESTMGARVTNLYPAFAVRKTVAVYVVSYPNRASPGFQLIDVMEYLRSAAFSASALMGAAPATGATNPVIFTEVMINVGIMTVKIAALLVTGSL